MERPAALTRGAGAFTILAAAAVMLGAPAAGAIRWTAPARIARSSIDVLSPQIAVAASGAAAVSFNEVNLDAQANASAFVSDAPARGRFRAAIPLGANVQEVLALAYSSRTLELLTAGGPPGQPCCTTVQVTHLEAGGVFSPPQTLVSNAGGGTMGQLVPLANGDMLAVIAGPERLWVAEARGAGRYAPARALTPAGVPPVALAVAGIPGGGSTVVWTEGAGQRVLAANGRPGRTPSRPRTVLSVPRGHEIDSVQLAPWIAGLTLAGTESWVDSTGAYHSRAVVADLTGGARAVRERTLSAPGAVASGLDVAGDGVGDQVAAWDVCSSDACAVESSVRGARGGWSPASRGGPIDAGQTPQVTMAPDRAALAGWITGGRVVLATLRPGASRFGARRRVSGSLADNLDLALGSSVTAAAKPVARKKPGARKKPIAAGPLTAVATWTQGTFAPDVFASVAR